MSIEFVQALVLGDEGVISLSHLTELSGLSEDELRELVECGALTPADATASSWTFSMRCVVVARTASRLREEFALDDMHSLSVVLRLVQRITELEKEIGALRGR